MITMPSSRTRQSHSNLTPDEVYVRAASLATKASPPVKHFVLLADDDASVRESLRKLFHAEGYQVVLAVNGEEAVEKFRSEQNRIDLLLVDLKMPLKNGWATLDRLMEINPSLPVLVLTGLPNQYELAEAAGVSALVEKPIDVSALLQLMQELLAAAARPPLQRIGCQNAPFHLLRSAGRASRYLSSGQSDLSYPHGGLNE